MTRSRLVLIELLGRMCDVVSMTVQSNYWWQNTPSLGEGRRFLPTTPALGERFLREPFSNGTSIFGRNIQLCPRPYPHGQRIMDAARVNGAHAINRGELRRGLVTSSTKRRISELTGLQRYFEDKCKIAISFGGGTWQSNVSEAN